MRNMNEAGTVIVLDVSSNIAWLRFTVLPIRALSSIGDSASGENNLILLKRNNWTKKISGKRETY